jgi:hypothetical protein
VRLTAGREEDLSEDAARVTVGADAGGARLCARRLATAAPGEPEAGPSTGASELLWDAQQSSPQGCSPRTASSPPPPHLVLS